MPPKRRRCRARATFAPVVCVSSSSHSLYGFFLRFSFRRLLHCLTMLASRFARRVASQSLRSASRVSARPVSPAARRFATTDAAHGAKESNDTPWMVRPSHVCVPHLTDPQRRIADWLCARFRPSCTFYVIQIEPCTLDSQQTRRDAGNRSLTSLPAVRRRTRRRMAMVTRPTAPLPNLRPRRRPRRRPLCVSTFFSRLSRLMLCVFRFSTHPRRRAHPSRLRL